MTENHSHREPIAVIASGGGMSCSYAAGAMVALAKEHRFTTPDFLIAGSGSAGTFAYYASKQYTNIAGVWLDLLSTRKFINRFRLWKIIDVDYLIDIIFKVKNHIDVDAMLASPITLLIAATDADTGDLTYFSDKEREDKREIFEFLRASKAMPIAFNRLIPIDGRRYCDSELSANLRAHVREAVRRGATRIIAINNSVPRLEASLAMAVWTRLRPRVFRERYREQWEELKHFRVPLGVRVELLEPSGGIPVSTLTSSRSGVRTTYDMGYRDMVGHKGIRDLLGIN
ncbi:MAG: patatin-like phospholipase family protein [Parcubacteria group bacterium]|nr:patatin-like phospholipase family protein [Parcubacteria group bacterium]